MDGPISPEQVPSWVPGRLTVQSPSQGWSGIALRGYAYPQHQVDVPAVRDHVIVAYRRGVTAMRRRTGGPWHHAEMRPGDISLLNSGAPTQWEWPSSIEVVHVYLDAARLQATCREMFDREVAELELHDVLKAQDPDVFRTTMMLAQEASAARPGSKLVVDSLTLQLGVQLLRNHASIVFKETRRAGGLTAAQQQAVTDYVHHHLDRNLSLEELAGSVGLSTYHFARRFREATGSTPHQFVVDQRLARAQEMLRRTARPLADVATACGFADASHLVRVFKKHLGVTPGQYRADR